jgi:hypothetical protein
MTDFFGDQADKHAKSMIRHDINGRVFMKLTRNDLAGLGFTIGHLIQLMERMIGLFNLTMTALEHDAQKNKSVQSNHSPTTHM